MRRRGSRTAGRTNPYAAWGCAGRCRRPLWTVSSPRAVALVDPGLGALVAGRADRLGGFGLDELLKYSADRLADQVDRFAGASYLQQIGYGRLWQGHRWGL